MEKEEFQAELDRLYAMLETVLEEQKRLWDAITGLRLEDTVGEMLQRYSDKMTLIRGGG